MPAAIKCNLIRCRQCKVDRYDDGTRCQNCGSYENPHIKYMGERLGWRDSRPRYTKRILQADEINQQGQQYTQ